MGGSINQRSIFRLFQMSFFDFSKCPYSTFPNVLLRLFQMSFFDFSKCRCCFKLSEVCRSTVHIKCLYSTHQVLDKTCGTPSTSATDVRLSITETHVLARFECEQAHMAISWSIAGIEK